MNCTQVDDRLTSIDKTELYAGGRQAKLHRQN
jgi:hypothetical protein